jgi:hypothetical protein
VLASALRYGIGVGVVAVGLAALAVALRLRDGAPDERAEAVGETVPRAA